MGWNEQESSWFESYDERGFDGDGWARDSVSSVAERRSLWANVGVLGAAASVLLAIVIMV
ncbi:MAG: hypothetical protein RBU37_17750 [Myxococcota bacterium]|nr:hypothetical protein [Myxococcota bacterium]